MREGIIVAQVKVCESLIQTNYSNCATNPCGPDLIVAKPSGVRKCKSRPLNPRGNVGSRMAVSSSICVLFVEAVVAGHTIGGL